MTLGKKGYFRRMRGQTQKQLGLLMGFSESTADTRIAQYECGVRTPKEELILTFARVLEISPLALTVPNISNFDELMHLLFMLEDEFGLQINSNRAGEVFLSFNSSDQFCDLNKVCFGCQLYVMSTQNMLL